MVERSKVWNRYLLIFAIFTISFISIDNRMVFNAQQQQMQNMMVKLNKLISIQNQNKLQIKLDKIAARQKQIRQKSTEQEQILASLKQEIGGTTYNEDIQVEDEILVEQRKQQEHEEEKGRVDQMMSNLESYWQNGQPISSESPVNESLLLESFGQVDEGTNIINVDCKSNLCKLELEQSPEAMFAVNNQFDENFSDSTIFSQSFPNEDGSQRVVMYVTQGQQDLTEIFE